MKLQEIAAKRMSQTLDVRTLLRTIAITKVLVKFLFEKEHYKMLAF